MLDIKDNKNLLDFISILQAQIQPFDNNFQTKVLNAISKVFRYNYLTFFSTNNGQLINPKALNIDPALMKKYMEYGYRLDLFHPTNIKKDLLNKNVVNLRELTTYEEYEKTEFYNYFMKCNNNMYYEVMLPLVVDNTLTGVIGILKPKEKGDFADKELIVLDKLNSFITYNLKMNLVNNKLLIENKLLSSSINQLPAGLIILDSDLSIINSNESAKEYCLDMAGRNCSIDYMKQAVNMMTSELFNKSFNINSSINADIGDYSIKLIPFIVPDASNSIKTIYSLYINNDASEKKNEINPFDQYKLTAREVEVTRLIAKGLSNEQIAKELFISFHTTKAHVENIFIKLNVNNRIALINKLKEN